MGQPGRCVGAAWWGRMSRCGTFHRVKATVLNVACARIMALVKVRCVYLLAIAHAT
jgi:hypothetical protein